jgi:hypothetical protein
MDTFNLVINADAIQWAQWAAYYVLICSTLVNLLGAVERILQTVEDWARDNFPEDTRFADKVQRLHRSVSAVADLINRFGAINFRDIIRPKNKRQDDRVTPAPITPAAEAARGGK